MFEVFSVPYCRDLVPDHIDIPEATNYSKANPKTAFHANDESYSDHFAERLKNETDLRIKSLARNKRPQNTLPAAYSAPSKKKQKKIKVMKWIPNGPYEAEKESDPNSSFFKDSLPLFLQYQSMYCPSLDDDLDITSKSDKLAKVAKKSIVMDLGLPLKGLVPSHLSAVENVPSHPDRMYEDPATTFHLSGREMPNLEELRETEMTYAKPFTDLCEVTKDEAYPFPFTYLKAVCAQALQVGACPVFYGLGSKRNLLCDLIESISPKAGIINVDGYHPTCSIKSGLETLAYESLGVTVRVGTAAKLLQVIREEIAKLTGGTKIGTKHHFHFNFHNLDGPELRNTASQQLFVEILALPRVTAFVSFDHANAHLLWTPDQRYAVKPFYISTPTFRPYDLEMAYHETFQPKSAQNRTSAKAMEYVLMSLTPNGRKIFKLIAELRLKHPNDKGISEIELFNLCQAQFFVSNMDTFKAQLVEFKDHKMLKTVREETGALLTTNASEEHLRVIIAAIDEM